MTEKLKVLSNEKTQIENLYNGICRTLTGMEPNCESLPLVYPIGTPGQQALLHYLSLTIANSDLPPDERIKVVFDNMSAMEYIHLSNFAEANAKCNY